MILTQTSQFQTTLCGNYEVSQSIMKDPIDLLDKIRILVVDDMEAILTLVRVSLRNMGVKNVEIAFDGESAWKILEKKPIDLIICDWEMPKMNGLELLTRIKESTQLKDIPMLLLTATTEKSLGMKALDAGVSDYLSKPFRPSDLESRVTKMLKQMKKAKP